MVLDYWRWAHSDLLDNAARGVLAEFLVAYAVSRTNEPRSEWGSFDVRTASGISVEVKSAAYAQSWPQKAPSKIRFDIAPRSAVWNPETNEYASYDPPARDADVYVFCLLGQPDDPDPDPLDLDQWEFYVLATATLNQERPRQRTIALNPPQVTRATEDRKKHDTVWRVGAHGRDVGERQLVRYRRPNAQPHPLPGVHGPPPPTGSSPAPTRGSASSRAVVTSARSPLWVCSNGTARVGARSGPG